MIYNYQDNVVISSTHIPLIMDFGISHLLSSTQTIDTATAADKGTVRWQSRELLFGPDGPSSDASDPLHHTKESDIWAFGMTCLVSIFLCEDDIRNEFHHRRYLRERFRIARSRTN